MCSHVATGQQLVAFWEAPWAAMEGTSIELEDLFLVIPILPVHVEGANMHFATIMCMLDVQSLTMSHPLEPLYCSDAVAPVT
jgi:hypothetical protein